MIFINKNLKLLILLITIYCLYIVNCEISEIITLPNYGKIQGISDEYGTHFKGIPFAQPPIGKLRWKLPIKSKPWNGILNTTEFSPSCYQECTFPKHTHSCGAKTSEDCLYLNIYIPKSASISNIKPVNFFIHGGNFRRGTAMCDLFDSRYIANKTNTIWVVTNYRLGALGFLKANTDMTGNYGLYDQNAALKWVQENIKYFGGDQNLVTLSGQSAGADSAVVHLTAKISRGLFKRSHVISMPWTLHYRSQSFASKLAKRTVNAANCSNLDCLYTLPPDQLLAAQQEAQVSLNIWSPLTVFYPWTMVVPSPLLADYPWNMIYNGDYDRNADIIQGFTANESAPFIYSAIKEPLEEWAYNTALDFLFPLDSGAIIRMYPAMKQDPNDARPQLQWLATHWIFHCSGRMAMKNFASYGKKPFVYYFNDLQHNSHYIFDGTDLQICATEVCHAADLAYWFNSARQLTDPNEWFNTEESILADQINNYQANFYYTGDPNVGPHATNATTKWDEFTFENNETLALNVDSNGGTQMQGGFQHKFCDFWDKITPNYHAPWKPLMASKHTIKQEQKLSSFVDKLNFWMKYHYPVLKEERSRS